MAALIRHGSLATAFKSTSAILATGTVSESLLNPGHTYTHAHADPSAAVAAASRTRASFRTHVVALTPASLTTSSFFSSSSLSAGDHRHASRYRPAQEPTEKGSEAGRREEGGGGADRLRRGIARRPRIPEAAKVLRAAGEFGREDRRDLRESSRLYGRRHEARGSLAPLQAVRRLRGGVQAFHPELAALHHRNWELKRFYSTPVDSTTPYEALGRIDLPKNLHIQQNYHRFHPDTDTMFNGKTAFPKSSTLVTGLKYKKKYPGHKQENPWLDEMMKI
ncbi:uncharacterized protein LOC105832642 isoform X1 [Monomorium pharaonis]|uniref:uncharacterized protein LOC105832642 isoform X1 n=1 Tax=Monomorium pharaonis TaxID=307658 RepID=UPI001746CECB|nr:uncharacterized protein LOC105832642 isoform X1 [Monomorium pharaonis]